MKISVFVILALETGYHVTGYAIKSELVLLPIHLMSAVALRAVPSCVTGQCGQGAALLAGCHESWEFYVRQLGLVGNTACPQSSGNMHQLCSQLSLAEPQKSFLLCMGAR